VHATTRWTHIAAGLATAALLATPSAPADAKKGGEWNPVIVPGNFVTTVDNEYFPLVVGQTRKYRADTKEGLVTVDIEVPGQTKVVMGVTTTVMIEREKLDGQTVEVSENWFAQDTDGNVWYFGEFSQKYENGVPAGTPGSWEAGVGGALPGIIMRANPQRGDAYFQESAPGIAEDQAEVKSTTETTTVLQSSQSGVVLTREWTGLEPGSVEKKYYAPGIGLVMEVKGNERLELFQIVN